MESSRTLQCRTKNLGVEHGLSHRDKALQVVELCHHRQFVVLMIDRVVKSSLIVIPALIRHPEHIDIAG
ncbi:MAG: hypothetical protein SWQ30_20830 [Thermodesulfobacteriota bacterium]|nr:hypothetical protein [Thermodesulfobacteriota bacterium]